MATPPRVTDAERDAAVTRIFDRHAHIDDPRRSALGDDPRDVVTFVLNRGPSGVPRWVQAADHHDALVLTSWCWWEERRRERRLLRQGLTLGLSASELGAPLGIRSRQGVRDRLDRLDALLTNDRPDEQLSRAARRADRDRGSDQIWLEAHRDEVQSVIAGLLSQGRRFLDRLGADESQPSVPDHSGDVAETASGDIAEWLDELEADYDAGVLSSATLAVAGLLAAEIRSHPESAALDRRCHLHSALRALDAVRTQLASGGS